MVLWINGRSLTRIPFYIKYRLDYTLTFIGKGKGGEFVYKGWDRRYQFSLRRRGPVKGYYGTPDRYFLSGDWSTFLFPPNPLPTVVPVFHLLPEMSVRLILLIFSKGYRKSYVIYVDWGCPPVVSVVREVDRGLFWEKFLWKMKKVLVIKCLTIHWTVSGKSFFYSFGSNFQSNSMRAQGRTYKKSWKTLLC